MNTSLVSNPTLKKRHGMEIFSFYRRQKARENDGDGNPLIYALKGIFDYSIPPCHRNFLLFQRAEVIFEKFSQKIDANYIMGVPSSHKLSHDLSLACSYWSGTPHMTFDFLQKRTNEEMLNDAAMNPPNISSKSRRKQYRVALSQIRKLPPSASFVMKDIHPGIRGYFNPLRTNGAVPNLAGEKIVIVDDLFSSGTSMRCCAEVLRDQGATVEQGICLLSGLR